MGLLTHSTSPDKQINSGTWEVTGLQSNFRTKLRAKSLSVMVTLLIHLDIGAPITGKWVDVAVRVTEDQLS